MRKPPELKVKNFDVIVPTHGRLDLTIRCLNALYNHTSCPFHLIVVDDSTKDMDGGTDLTGEWFERFMKIHDNVTFVHSDEPYREGNQIFNIGLERAKYQFVATMSNSITVEPEWERVALQFMFEHPEVGITGLRQLRPWGRIESAGIAMVGWRPTDLGRDHPSHRFSSLYEVDAVAWALAIVRRKAINGDLPEGIYAPFRGWDDIDNCFVLRKNGWKVWFCGYGCGYHEARATRASSKEDARLARLNNAEIFSKRWGFVKEFEDSKARDELEVDSIELVRVPELIEKHLNK